MTQLYTIPEVQDRLRVCESTVYNLISSGDLKSLKVGRSRRVSEAQLAAFVSRRERKG